MKKYEVNSLFIWSAVITIVLALVAGIYGSRVVEFQHSIETILFPFIISLLEIVGAGIIVFGSSIILLKFVMAKLKDAYKPSGVSPYYARYLTLGLEFMIAAEIVKTSIVKTWDELTLLILVVAIRALLGFINHLEGKWSRLQQQAS